MSDDTTLPGIARTDSVGSADFTDNSLITDFTQIVSYVVGKDRNEGKRQKFEQDLFATILMTSISLPLSHPPIFQYIQAQLVAIRVTLEPLIFRADSVNYPGERAGFDR